MKHNPCRYIAEYPQLGEFNIRHSVTTVLERVKHDCDAAKHMFSAHKQTKLTAVITSLLGGEFISAMI